MISYWDCHNECPALKQWKVKLFDNQYEIVLSFTSEGPHLPLVWTRFFLLVLFILALVVLAFCLQKKEGKKKIVLSSASIAPNFKRHILAFGIGPNLGLGVGPLSIPCQMSYWLWVEYLEINLGPFYTRAWGSLTHDIHIMWCSRSWRISKFILYYAFEGLRDERNSNGWNFTCCFTWTTSG